MARTTPVHTGYTIVNGVGTGTNGHRIDVWVEYKAGTANIAGNYTPVTAWFYAALNPGYTSTTAYAGGLNSSFFVNGTQAEGVSGGDYDFSSADNVHLLGSFQGNIPHNADGTKELTFQGSFTTNSSYISGGSIQKTVSLPAIPRAAAVTAAAAILGEKCAVRWTPAAKDHSFGLTFTLGDWSAITPRIYPDSTAAYVYRGQILPLEAARQFSGTSGQMEVKLTTYSGNAVLGSTTANFSVTLPENDHTRPQVMATLSPDCPAFPGEYVQHLGKVAAQVNATDPLGAAITGVQITVGTVTTEGTLSAYLETAGAVTVQVRATNSRGFTGTFQATIQVLPYEAPRFTLCQAYRCSSEGNEDASGTYLYLAAAAVWSPVKGYNKAVLRWQYKLAGGSYSDWQTLTAGVAPGVALLPEKAYLVHLEVTDTAGARASAEIPIPTEQVYMHRTAKAMGLGGYAQGENVLDLHWDLVARGGINGAYICTATLSNNRTLRFLASDKQSVLIFGYCDRPIQGLLSISAEGCTWTGTAGVSATQNSGQITLTLPGAGTGKLVLISPYPIHI